MKLIVGLGNPGREYKNTRHNVGFMVVDNYLGKVKWKDKFESSYYIDNTRDEQIIFIKPLTYMNLSGKSVKRYVDFYNINMEDVLIIQDDLDIDLGKYKIKKNSSSGGHNGIKSIIAELGSDDFARLKIGISNGKNFNPEKYVTAKFYEEEYNNIVNNYEVFNNIIESFIDYDIDKTMQNYNKK